MKKTLMAIAMLLGSNAFAAGDAGCGLGSLIIKSNGKLSQLMASTTNATSGSQMFGITFGTSNCTASGLVQNDKQIQYFVEVNKDDLSREMAQGHGQKLSTLAVLHGCSDALTINSFAAQTQKNYGAILPSAQTTAVDMVQNLKNSNIAQMCHGS